MSIQVHTLHKFLKKDSEKSERMSEESEIWHKSLRLPSCEKKQTHEKEAYANLCSTQAHDVFVFVFVFSVPT